MATTAAARSGSRPRAAAWSASSRLAGRVSVGPDVGDSFLVSDGVLTRTVAETAAAARRARRLRDRRRDLGAASPRSVRRVARLALPGRWDRAGAQPAVDGAEVDPVCERAARDAAALLESLGHHVEEITPPWSGPELLPDFTRAVRADGRADRVARRPPGRTRARARRRRAADLGDVRAGAPARLDRVPGGAEPAAVGRADAGGVPLALRRRDHARARPAPAAHRRGARPRPRPLGPLPALGAVHAVHRDLQRDRAAGGRRCRYIRATTACRWACR